VNSKRASVIAQLIEEKGMSFEQAWQLLEDVNTLFWLVRAEVVNPNAEKPVDEGEQQAEG